MRYLAIVLIFFFSNHVQSDQLKLFTSDGCSLFPDGTYLENQLWLSCCVKHDLAYWMGGTRDRRKQADDELRQCVQDKDKTFLAKLMHNGVRVGGTPYLPTHFRWAYG
ncbi:MAG: hypothetical protein OEZ58_12305, partial [Gammaproteobacteria bacterium]|nr:hypothetical protein [Gammaproteobacteria bacterium]